MLKEHAVPVRYEQLLEDVRKDRSRIVELQVRDGSVYRAKVYIDVRFLSFPLSCSC